MAEIASVSSPWLPGDDLLLKNAIEGGASLEALAKGAVRFSQRFTLREIEDRWCSMLYDPDISTQASARMVEFELSASVLPPKSNRFGNSKGSAEVSKKRKVQSIRKHYYAMRKRFCCETFKSSDLCVADVHDTDGLEAKTISALDMMYGGDNGKNSISECLVNFEIGDNPFMDVDAKDALANSDNLNSLLLNSPDNSHEDDACPAEVDVIADQLHAGPSIQHSLCRPDISMPSTSSGQKDFPLELSDGLMPCILNSEDPDIPCNDDIFPPKALPVSAKQLVLEEASEHASLFDKQNLGARHLCLTNKEKYARSSSDSQIVAPDMLPETTANHVLVGCAVNSKFPDGNCLVWGSRHAKNCHVESGQRRPVNAASKSSIKGAREEDAIHAKLTELHAPATFEEHFPLHKEPIFTKMAYSEPASNPSTSDQEELYSDDDLPSFSDIEAMILDMDLCPHDQDSLSSKEVSRYQSEESKRTIIRLEQSAHCSLQRAIASQGALAILYGRHSRHYIKKAEVILGRATDDIDVDIDLGRERRANKISRRQGSIKMVEDGSFFLRNIGKGLISVNGKDVAAGQCIKLHTSSLIEIKGLEFVFEVDPKYVRQFLANIRKKEKESQEKDTPFEWSPEGEA